MICLPGGGWVFLGLGASPLKRHSGVYQFLRSRVIVWNNKSKVPVWGLQKKTKQNNMVGANKHEIWAMSHVSKLCDLQHTSSSLPPPPPPPAFSLAAAQPLANGHYNNSGGMDRREGVWDNERQLDYAYSQATRE